MQSVPFRVGVNLEKFGGDERVENWPFRELDGYLMWLSTSTRPNISNAVRAVARYCTAPKGFHWLASRSILTELVNTLLHFSEGLCLVFRWKFSRMLTTPLRQLTGGRYQVDRLCVEVLVYIGFPGLINALPFRLQKQSTLLSGTL